MLPFWGDPSYLYEAVDSVLAQDSDQWRLVIVDDHYPDELVAQHFAALDDPRITYLRNENNLGITDNYRKCLSLVEADYMMFMGCDDVMAPNYISTMLAAIEQFPQADIIQPGVQVIDEHGEVYRPLGDKVKDVMTPSPAKQHPQRGVLVVDERDQSPDGTRRPRPGLLDQCGDVDGADQAQALGTRTIRASP